MQGNNAGNEFKAVAKDVMQLGARCVQAGRGWLTERRNEMADRNDEHPSTTGEKHRQQPERQAPQNQRHGMGSGAYTQGSQGFGGYAGRQAGEGYGDSSGYGRPDADSYIDRSGYRAQPYAVPGDTQPSYGAETRHRSYAGLGPKNYSRSDERITEDLCERLTHDHDIDASDIEVRVASGTATLDGTVAQRWMKHRAEDLADSCSGVRHVENRIRVQSKEPVHGAGSRADTGGSSVTGKSGGGQAASPTAPTATGGSTGGQTGQTPH